MNKLLTPFNKNGLELKNHIVMAPLTRSRAIKNIPNSLMTEYYGQRTGAGLIITEGTAPMADGLGYPRIPGIFTEDQVEGWKNITERVRKGGSKFFVQLMHTGHIAHEDNIPKGGEIFAPSSIKAEGKIFTDTRGLQDHSTPKAFTTDDIKRTIAGHVKAAKNAVIAGFDGVELHGAHGYLTEQFLNPNSNQREDEYGGSIENRARFAIETTQAVADSIGADKIGIRLSPFAFTQKQLPYDEHKVHKTYQYLVEELNKIGIQYIHLSMQDAPENTYRVIREIFSGTVIQCNGLTPKAALEALNGLADLVAFGRSFLANPDLVKRIELGAELNEPDPDTFYTPGPEGYTDYPILNVETA
ncbi:MAG TPA: alkene reductase [Fodinibius sp.]|nr:alkene reductase [Fodinibius sp.]